MNHREREDSLFYRIVTLGYYLSIDTTVSLERHMWKDIVGKLIFLNLFEG